MQLRANGDGQIIQVAGSPFEQGLAHGRGAAKRIRVNVEALRAGIALLEGTGVSIDFDRITSANESFVDKHAPEVLEEIQGISAGSGIRYEDLLSLNLPAYLAATLAQDCSQILLQPPATLFGQTYLAKTRDVARERFQHVVLHRTYSDGFEMVEAHIAGTVTWPGSGVNSHGVALSTSGVWPRTLPVNFNHSDRGWILANTHLLLRHSSSVDDVTRRLCDMPRLSGINIVATDMHGAGAALEATASGVYRADASRGIVVRTNHWCAPELSRFTPTLNDNPSSHDRYATAMRLIDERYGKWEIARVWALLKSHIGYPNSSLCRHGLGQGGSETIFASIVTLPSCEFEFTVKNPCLRPASAPLANVRGENDYTLHPAEKEGR